MSVATSTIAPKKLHLGCGGKYIPGFFHVDVNEHPHIDLRATVDKLDGIESNSVELIYASHLLEHFDRHEVDAVLAEWRRVLRPGGVLRLAVPNFGACARLYADGRLEHGLDDILGLVVGGQKDAYDYHKMVFDEASLERRLKQVGFREVRLWDWRSTEHAGMDDYSQAYLPHMDKEHGTSVSLNVEAIK